MQRHLDLFMKYIFGQNLPKIANYIEYLIKASHHNHNLLHAAIFHQDTKNHSQSEDICM